MASRHGIDRFLNIGYLGKASLPRMLLTVTDISATEHY